MIGSWPSTVALALAICGQAAALRVSGSRDDVLGRDRMSASWPSAIHDAVAKYRNMLRKLRRSKGQREVDDSYNITYEIKECGGGSNLLASTNPDSDYPFPQADPEYELLLQTGSSPAQASADPHDRDHTINYDPTQRYSEPVQLDGRQFCRGSTTKVKKNKKVALVLTGQAYRARDFFHRHGVDCLPRSKKVQQRVIENHHEHLIDPLEAMGFSVDVFLGITPCSLEHIKGVLEPVPHEFNTSGPLTELYGAQRVKGLFQFNRTVGMYQRMADTFNQLDQRIESDGSYEYFVFLRYDVFLDRPFTELFPPKKGPHGGLSFFFRVHDFMFGFPGEFWNCMRTFWDGCMATIRNRGINEIGIAERRSLGCFDIGPLHIGEWAQGYAFDYVLKRITMVGQWKGFLPYSPTWPLNAALEPWHTTGTSAFDRNGTEHRCHSSWFWPPKSSWEHEHMPYYFHVGTPEAIAP